MRAGMATLHRKRMEAGQQRLRAERSACMDGLMRLLAMLAGMHRALPSLAQGLQLISRTLFESTGTKPCAVPAACRMRPMAGRVIC